MRLTWVHTYSKLAAETASYNQFYCNVINSLIADINIKQI